MGKFRSPRVVPRERVRSPKFESRRVKLLRDGCACVARVKLGMRNVLRVHVTDIWSWYRVELRVGDHLGRSEELVSRCVECDLAEPESLASLGGSAPGVVDGNLSNPADIRSKHWEFATVWPMLRPILFWRGEAATQLKGSDRIPSTTPGAEPPRDARDSGSARSHSMHLETSSSDRP